MFDGESCRYPEQRTKSSSYRCDGREYRAQMRSCAEAIFFSRIARMHKWMAMMMGCRARNNVVIEGPVVQFTRYP